jgi:capsular polysaccharide transport system ATP-binding protein
MIILDNVTSVAMIRKRKRNIVASASLVLPSDRRIALLGSSHEAKRILVDVISGIAPPTSGRIIRKANVSFPVGHTRAFLPGLSARKNVEHLARIYGADVKTVVDFVENAVSLGSEFDKPYLELDPISRKRIAQIVAYSIEFDVYVLADEVIPSRASDTDASYQLFLARSRAAGMIIPTRSPDFARKYCESALVLENGRLLYFQQVDRALAVLRRIVRTGRGEPPTD